MPPPLNRRRLLWGSIGGIGYLVLVLPYRVLIDTRASLPLLVGGLVIAVGLAMLVVPSVERWAVRLR